MISNRTLVIAGFGLVVALLIRAEYRMDVLEDTVVVTGEAVVVVADHVSIIEKKIVAQPRALDKSYTAIVDINRRVKYTKQDLQCMAKNIYYEAGVENKTGKYAVGTVTMNRLKTRHWGRSVCDVVYARAQFSWTDHYSTRFDLLDKDLNKQTWKESVEIAKHVFAGARVSGLQHSLFYHADYIDPPEWVDVRYTLGQLGTHIFYSKAKDSWVKI